MKAALRDDVLDALGFARQIADHASLMGEINVRAAPRLVSEHTGAVLADAVLQAGLNYRTVVRPRISRIMVRYPEAKTVRAVKRIVARGETNEFLLWQGGPKIARFEDLVSCLAQQEIEDVRDLKTWLRRPVARATLLSIRGIGPKTFDYLCCLVGIDTIAVDRHVRVFAHGAGVDLTEYNDLKLVVSYAADLLGIARRDFDAWIWERFSGQNAQRHQPELALGLEGDLAQD